MSHVLLVLLDIESEYEDALDHAYPDHLAQRLTYAGFRTAQHLVLAEGNGPRHLAWYELGTPDAATSREYLSHPADATSQIIADHGNLRVRAVYSDDLPTPSVTPVSRELLLLADSGPHHPQAYQRAAGDGLRMLNTETSGAPRLLAAWPGAATLRRLSELEGLAMHGLYR
jgi:hypothetical protein